MADDLTSALFPSFFFPGSGNKAQVNSELRQKMAMALLMQKRKAPSNIGEGLTAIGDAIGDRGIMNSLESQDLQQQAAAAGMRTPPAGGVEPSPASAAPAPVTPTIQEPPPVSSAPLAPASKPMFRPGVGGPATEMVPAAPAAPLPPDQQQSFEPGAPMRMPTQAALQDWKNQNPLPPNIPPPPGAPPAALAPPAGSPPRPSVADYGQKLALAPTPGGAPAASPEAPGDDPRRAIALAMLRNGQGVPTGQPSAPPAPTPMAAPTPPADQGIRPAPPQEAYVPPDPGAPQGATILQPSARERQLQASVARAMISNPYAAQSPDAMELQLLTQERTKRQTEADEMFKARLTRGNEQAKLREQGLMDRDSRTLANQKAARDLQQPVLTEDVKSKYVFNPATGSYQRPTVAGDDPTRAPEVRMNGEQAKEQKFHSWAMTAEDQLDGKDKILADGAAEKQLGKVPFVGNQLLSSQYRQASNAAERWVQGFMRDISGAAIGTEEFAKHMRTFFPQPGDDAKTIADKRAARANAMDGMYNAAGPGREISDWETKQRREKRSAADAATEKEMQGAPKVVGQVLVDDAGRRRTWTGKRWEDL